MIFYWSRASCRSDGASPVRGKTFPGNGVGGLYPLVSLTNEHAMQHRASSCTPSTNAVSSSMSRERARLGRSWPLYVFLLRINDPTTHSGGRRHRWGRSSLLARDAANGYLPSDKHRNNGTTGANGDATHTARAVRVNVFYCRRRRRRVDDAEPSDCRLASERGR